VLAKLYNIEPGMPWLVAVGMMRYGDKLASYQQLGRALAKLENQDFRLIIAGDGEARNEVMTAMRPLGPKVIPIGQAAPETVPILYAASDICVWPAVNEAYGMSLLEAHASGIPVISSRTGGVPDIVEHEETGILVEPGDIDGFASAVSNLLRQPQRRQQMGLAAYDKVQKQHHMQLAADRIDTALKHLSAVDTSIDLTSFGF
jgi:glycosyltransferase involved in cell wall biosynthesis